MPHFYGDKSTTQDVVVISKDQFDGLVDLLTPIRILAIKQLEMMGLDPDGLSLVGQAPTYQGGSINPALVTTPELADPTSPSADFEVPPSNEQH